MTDTQFAMALAAVPPTIVALGGFILGIMNRSALAKNTQVTTEIDKKTEVVAAHVNSQKTKDNATIESQAKQIADLLAIIAEKKETAALLAQAAASAVPPGAA